MMTMIMEMMMMTMEMTTNKITVLRMERRSMEQSRFIGGIYKQTFNLNKHILVTEQFSNIFTKSIEHKTIKLFPQVHLGKYAREGVVLDR